MDYQYNLSYSFFSSSFWKINWFQYKKSWVIYWARFV